MFIDKYKLFTRQQAQEIVLELEKMDVWQTGKARTEWATGTIKQNQEVNWNDGEDQQVITTKVRDAIHTHPRLTSDHLIKKIMMPKFNKYAAEYGDAGGQYKRHGDVHSMGGKVRTDFAMTLFLSHPDTYEGGDLNIECEDGHSTASVKGDPGMAVVYPCWRPHWVTPVTKGTRICAITWLESLVPSEDKREVLRRFGLALNEMEADPNLRNHRLMTSFGTVKSKLLRMWCDAPELG